MWAPTRKIALLLTPDICPIQAYTTPLEHCGTPLPPSPPPRLPETSTKNPTDMQLQACIAT